MPCNMKGHICYSLSIPNGLLLRIQITSPGNGIAGDLLRTDCCAPNEKSIPVTILSFLTRGDLSIIGNNGTIFCQQT